MRTGRARGGGGRGQTHPQTRAVDIHSDRKHPIFFALRVHVLCVVAQTDRIMNRKMEHELSNSYISTNSIRVKFGYESQIAQIVLKWSLGVR